MFLHRWQYYCFMYFNFQILREKSRRQECLDRTTTSRVVDGEVGCLCTLRSHESLLTSDVIPREPCVPSYHMFSFHVGSECFPLGFMSQSWSSYNGAPFSPLCKCY